MRAHLPLLLALGSALAACADPDPELGPRLSGLYERGPSVRHALLGAVREAKESADPNGAAPLVEALVAWADGRALEASEFAARAAACETVDFGDRAAARAALDAGRPLPTHATRWRDCRALLEFLLAWGEEWEWRGKGDSARSAYVAAAALAAHLGRGSVDLSEALALANLEYRGRHRLAGLALRAGDEEEFRAQAALANEAHVARTGLAAAQTPSTREELAALVEVGPLALVRDCPDPPDHPVRALLEAPKTFAGKSPSAVLVLALGDRFGDRAVTLRWDAALALRPHAKEAAAAVRKWVKSADDPRPGLALLSAAGETVAVPEGELADPWAARACGEAETLACALRTLPRERRCAVAFRLKDLRGEDELDLGE